MLLGCIIKKYQRKLCRSTESRRTHKMRPYQLFYVTTIVSLGSYTIAVPVETTSDVLSDNSSKDKDASQDRTPTTVLANSSGDLETSHSNPEPSYVLPQPHSSTGAAHFDPSIYSGFLTPEAFQQYLAQFAGAFAPYAYPGYGPAPAPVYPGPYAVQTGYDGFLVPSVSASLSASGSTSSTSLGSTLLTALQNLITNLMSSPLGQIIMTALSAILMVLFGGAMTTAICNFTPLCDISFKAVTYLRGNGAGDVGRMLAEEMTPERVRRAAEFVRNAIKKYNEMQRMMKSEDEME